MPEVIGLRRQGAVAVICHRLFGLAEARYLLKICRCIVPVQNLDFAGFGDALYLAEHPLRHIVFVFSGFDTRCCTDAGTRYLGRLMKIAE